MASLFLGACIYQSGLLIVLRSTPFAIRSVKFLTLFFGSWWNSTRSSTVWMMGSPYLREEMTPVSTAFMFNIHFTLYLLDHHFASPSVLCAVCDTNGDDRDTFRPLFSLCQLCKILKACPTDPVLKRQMIWCSVRCTCYIMNTHSRFNCRYWIPYLQEIGLQQRLCPE